MESVSRSKEAKGQELESMKPIPNPYPQGRCFFCGPRNAQGLRLNFYQTKTDPPELVCRWTASPVYQGLGRVLHGGIQSGLFDEIMGWTALHLTRRVGVTSELNIQFLKPVYVDQEIEVRCHIHAREGNKVHLTAWLKDEGGEICTRATGTYVLLDQARFQALVGLK